MEKENMFFVFLYDERFLYIIYRMYNFFLNRYFILKV